MKINQYTWDPEKDLIAEGAFAEVFRALDTNTQGRVVALKIYKEAVAKGTQGSSNQKKYSLEEEFRKIDGLSHTNIITYYGQSYLEHKDAMGRSSSYPLIVMEYAEHGTLTDFLKTRPSSAIIDKLIKEIIQGVAYLHSEGILHRDLKPGNILITSNRKGEPVAKITDFGISRDLLDEAETLERSMTAGVGTPHYMAPEQFFKKTYGLEGEISVRTDIWAIGVIIYRLLTGARPFGGGDQDFEEVRDEIIRQNPKLEGLGDCHSLVMSCLMKKADHRPAGALDLLPLIGTEADETLQQTWKAQARETNVDPVVLVDEEDLPTSEFDTHEDPVAESPMAPPTGPKPEPGRSKTPLIVVSALVLIAIVAAIVYFNLPSDADPAEPEKIAEQKEENNGDDETQPLGNEVPETVKNSAEDETIKILSDTANIKRKNLLALAVSNKLKETKTENTVFNLKQLMTPTRFNGFGAGDYEAFKSAITNEEVKTAYGREIYDSILEMAKDEQLNKDPKDIKAAVVMLLDTENATVKLLNWRTRYKRVGDFYYGLAIVEKGDKIGYVNKQGEVVIPIKYWAGGDFDHGVAVVSNSTNERGLIDQKGNVLAPLQYTSIQYGFKDGLARVERKVPNESGSGSRSLYGFINKAGKEVIPPKYEFVQPFNQGLALVYTDYVKECIFINVRGEKAVPGIYWEGKNFANGYAAVRKAWNEDWSVINLKGEVITKDQYDEIGYFLNDYCPVKKGEKWGMINAKGELAVPLEYEGLGRYSEGLVPVKKDEKWGYMDLGGKLIIDHQYSAYSSFENGRANVLYNGKSVYIDKTGKVIQ